MSSQHISGEQNFILVQLKEPGPVQIPVSRIQSKFCPARSDAIQSLSSHPDPVPMGQICMNRARFSFYRAELGTFSFLLSVTPGQVLLDGSEPPPSANQNQLQLSKWWTQWPQNRLCWVPTMRRSLAAHRPRPPGGKLQFPAAEAVAQKRASHRSAGRTGFLRRVKILLL